MTLHAPVRTDRRASSYSAAMDALRAYRNLRTDRDAAANRAYLVEAVRGAAGDDGRRQPWPHQLEAIQATAAHFASGATNAICVVPTAGGKTEVFQRLVAAAHRHAGDRDLRTVVLVPTRQLIVQTVERFDAEFPWLGAGRVGTGLGTHWAPVTVMTYARFAAMASRGRIRPGDIDFLVMDEAHRGLSEIRQGHFRRFVGTALISAFSATPVFDVNKNVYRLLGSGNEVLHVTIKRLIAERRIAPVVNVIVGVNIVGEMPADHEIQSRILKAAAARAMLDVRENLAFEDLGFSLAERTFVAYARDIDHGVGTAAAFRERHPESGVEAISYLTPQDAQADALEALAAGRIAGVFNAMVLLEGTDIPTLGAVYNLAPTTSLVRQMQRCGRALRLDPSLDPADPRQTGVVVDFFFRFNGRMLGRPVFYCDAIGDRTIARAYETAPIDVGPLLAAAEVDLPVAPPAQDAEAIRNLALDRAEAAVEEDVSPVGAVAAAEDAAHETAVDPVRGRGGRAAAVRDAGDGEPVDGEADPEADDIIPGSDGPLSAMREGDVLDLLPGIRIIASIVDVVAIGIERDAVRFGARDPDFIGRTDAAIKLGVAFDTPATKGLFDGIEAEVLPAFRLDPSASLTVVREGLALDVSYRRVGFAFWIQYRVDQLDRLAALVEAASVRKGEDWVSQTEVCGGMGVRDPWRTLLRALIAEFSGKRRSMRLSAEPIRRRPDAWLRADTDPSKAEGAREIRMELCLNGNSKVVCFHRDDVAHVRLAVGLDNPATVERTEDWVGFGEVTALIGVKSNPIRKAMKELNEAYAAAGGADGAERVVPYQGRTFRMRRVTRGATRTYPCMHVGCLDDLVATSGLELGLPAGDDWLGVDRLATACGVEPTERVFQRCWKRIYRQSDLGQAVDLNGEALTLAKRRQGRIIQKCLSRDSLEAFARGMARERGSLVSQP